MLKIIVYKEISENITSYRNLITTFLCAVLFLSSAVIMTRDYQNRQVNYSLRDKMGQTRVGMRPKLAKPPTPLSVLARGLDENMGQLIFIWWSQPRKEVGADVVDPGERNPLFSLFTAPDFIYIFKIVMSILALFFAFDSICGEKERGTLKMMLASGKVSRGGIIIGKWLGGYLNFLICMMPALLLVLIWIAIHPALDIGGEDWSRISLIVLSSLAYISIFFLLGLFVSTLTHRGATSLLIILLLWVVWAMGAPNLGLLLAKRLSPVSESLAFMSQKQEIRNRDFGSGMERTEAYWQADDSYIAEVNRQADLIQKLTRISPLASYTYIATALARTGVAESQSYRRSVIDWDRNIRRISSRQMGEYVKEMAKYRAGNLSIQPERPKGTYEWAKEVPFAYKEMRLSDVLKTIWIDIFLILAINIILFMAAYLAFLKYDIR